MKKGELKKFLQRLIEEARKEYDAKLYKVEISINMPGMVMLKKLQQRFGAQDIAETLKMCMLLAKACSDQIEEGGAIVFLKRRADD